MSVAEFFIAYVGIVDPFQNDPRAYPPALIAAAAVVYIGYSAGTGSRLLTESEEKIKYEPYIQTGSTP